MNPLRPFIRTLPQMEQEHHGAVEYKSAYIDGTDSTRVIHSGHSVQETPDGIEEVLLRRNGMRADRWDVSALGLVILLGLAGCAGQGPTAAQAPVAVTDVASVAGKWVGLLEIAGSRNREDYIEVTIEGSGAYRATAARTIGVMDARGTVAVASGRLLIKGESGGQGAAILYTQPPPDQRMLVVNGTAADGRPYTARLRPQR
jgi:hypothetical protein